MDIDKTISENAFNKLIPRPTLYIYGTEDPVIAPEIIPLQEALIDTTYTILALPSGHSLMQKAEGEVIRKIMMHLEQSGSTDVRREF